MKNIILNNTNMSRTIVSCFSFCNNLDFFLDERGTNGNHQLVNTKLIQLALPLEQRIKLQP
jgi:hypothetical protein